MDGVEAVHISPLCVFILEGTMETKRLEVTAEGKKVYDIVIENNFNQLVKELSVFGIKERKLCIVTERQVASYYLEEV